MLEFFKSLGKKEPKQEPKWDYTANAYSKVEDLGSNKKISQNSKESRFFGKHIIGRDTKINGGVYFTRPTNEVIVVDDTEDTELIRIYTKLFSQLREIRKETSLTTSILLTTIWNFVIAEMPYSSARVAQIITRASEQHDPRVSLSRYLGGGVCRHQGLLVAYLLEKLITEHKIKGKKVSVDRNHTKDNGHAWARYTSSSGAVWIIDPAKKYIGTLKNAKEDENLWPYARPEDGNTFIHFLRKLDKILIGK